MTTDAQARNKPAVADAHREVVVKCPATGEVVGTVPVAAAAEVEAVAARLREAQPAWQRLGVEGRARWLGTWRDWLLDHAGELNTLVQLEGGKSWGDTYAELLMGIQVLNYWIDNAAEFLADESVRPSGVTNAAKKLTVVYEPYQLVGDITPWNGPLAGPLLDIPAALMAGCAVLSKPSEFAPLGWQAAVDGWKDIGAPDVLHVVNGFGETGAALVDVVDYVMFTGSVGTGRRMATAAAQRLIPYSLELGGKDAMIVCADADIDRAVDGAVWGGFVMAGQACISVERLYVEEPVYDEFMQKLVAKTSQLRLGMDTKHDYSCDVGSLATEQQRAIVSRHVEDAVSKGAKVLTGGKARDDGFFYEPTVLADVDHSMDCMREETFGPTLPVMKVKDDEEAIRLANDSPYGLASSVFSSDPERADRVARRLEAGAVNINSVLTAMMLLVVPSGGWKTSGIGGRNGGAAGILKFCREQSIISERFTLKAEPHWYPHSPRSNRALALLVRLTGAHDWQRRLGRKGRR
ncbi:MAG: hypothetical protein QOE41_919 [Mycobacterium sp.]|nr:hypothetical protein [Mycobacterium sp.]